PASFSFWQQLAQIFIADVCKQNSGNEKAKYTFSIPVDEISSWLTQAPFMRGIEYLQLATAESLWHRLAEALEIEIIPFDRNIGAYLSAYHAAWNTVGRVCFHLAENKNNSDHPFAFLATYTTRLSNTANTQHVPLGRALEEYAGSNKKSQLLSLLLPVHRSTEKSHLLKNLVDTGNIFKPQFFSAHEAHHFLKDIPLFEAAGVMIRVPNWWNSKKPPRPSISVSVDKKDTSTVGLDALLNFNLQLALPDGEQLTSQELKNLLNNTDKLVKIKGQWVEIDNDKLNQVLLHWQTIERQVEKNGLSFSEGLRLLAGVSKKEAHDASLEDIAAWSKVTEGPWLKEALERLRHPDITRDNNHITLFKKYLRAKLRPYQERGVQWLWWLYNMHLGGCLADDMGLGKTIQIISLMILIHHKTESTQKKLPHLLVLPASLVGNWQAEINRFAPTLTTFIAHSSSMQKDSNNKPLLSDINLVITTYGMLNRLPWLTETSWDMVILDEAQAIKNPSSKQAQATKLLNNQVRFVLTGTPIENRLLDLWSLFDFIAPGLLGSNRIFANYSKQKAKEEPGNPNKNQFYAAVRQLVSPYILRRLKSDKSIISDLPDKTEMQTYCTLTKQQIGFYQQAVMELSSKLEQQQDGIQRRGLVLSYLMRFKQICNHPNQWLGHGKYEADKSGKFERLKELCEVIAEKQEKVLVFTQFREIIPALCDFMTTIFGQSGLFLHGQTSIKERSKRVDAFQNEEGPPFFVLSLKAGGTGLNLTAASHVIHFDRWWNPAVENQATDRAYRIGQKKNVLVHKFICRGTIEEKIDSLINDKKTLAQEVIGEGSEMVITELSDAELLNVVTLDIHRALGENEALLLEHAL
ncbi:MAG: hypothetical protein A3E82_05720, partial [Gammaproteobacteria bacterium RIFCSPHIGHO2_12_FULL_38_11]